MNRPVRSRMQGGVGAGGEKPPATRFMFYFAQNILLIYLNKPYDHYMVHYIDF
jgi:hypothetical protein